MQQQNPYLHQNYEVSIELQTLKEKIQKKQQKTKTKKKRELL